MDSESITQMEEITEEIANFIEELLEEKEDYNREVIELKLNKLWESGYERGFYVTITN